MSIELSASKALRLGVHDYREEAGVGQLLGQNGRFPGTNPNNQTLKCSSKIKYNNKRTRSVNFKHKERNI